MNMTPETLLSHKIPGPDSGITIKKAICNVCGGDCILNAYQKDGALLKVEPCRDLPFPSGFCAKGAACRQYLFSPERVRTPLRRVGPRGSGSFEPVSWEEALSDICRRLLHQRQEHGPQSAVFYCGHPKWYRSLLARLACQYGSPNFCTESSTCFHAVALAWKSVFGTMPLPPDLSACRTLLIWAANPMHSSTPRADALRRAKERGVTILCVDPRDTHTTQLADLHLKPRPGTDGALALAMGHVILEEGLEDAEFLRQYSFGFAEYREYVRTFTPEKAEAITGCPAEQIRRAARLFAQNTPSAIQFSASPVVHNCNGVQNYRAIFLLLALTGNFDRPGGNCAYRPGVRLNGGEVAGFPRVSGIPAIGDEEFPAWRDLCPQETQGIHLADAILEQKPYPIRSVVAFGMNHRMWPQPERLLQALSTLDFFVSVDFFLTDSAKYADYVLPAATSWERELVQAVGGSWLFYQDKVIQPYPDVKNDVEILLALAHGMELHDPVLDLPDYEAWLRWRLEPSGVSLEELRAQPGQLMQARRTAARTPRCYEAGLPTPSGKVEFRSQALERYAQSHGYQGLPVYEDYRERLTPQQNQDYPLTLSTGCRKPQRFHSRCWRMSWLENLEPLALEMHPEDARPLGIADGRTVRLETRSGSMTIPCRYNPSGVRGTVFLYHGKPGQDANELIPLDYCDPISGFPGYKSCPCRVLPDSSQPQESR